MTYKAKEPSEEVKKSMLNIIGYAGPITRPVLLSRLNSMLSGDTRISSDRRLRQYVQWMRINTKRGAFIMSASSGGYFMGNEQDLENEIARETSRAVTIFSGLRKRAALAKLELSTETRKQLNMFM